MALINVLILGANGQLARNTIPLLLNEQDVTLTLYLRRDQRLKNCRPGPRDDNRRRVDFIQEVHISQSEPPPNSATCKEP